MHLCFNRVKYDSEVLWYPGPFLAKGEIVFQARGRTDGLWFEQLIGFGLFIFVTFEILSCRIFS